MPAFVLRPHHKVFLSVRSLSLLAVVSSVRWRQSIKTNRMAPSLEEAFAQLRKDDRKSVNSRFRHLSRSHPQILDCLHFFPARKTCPINLDVERRICYPPSRPSCPPQAVAHNPGWPRRVATEEAMGLPRTQRSPGAVKTKTRNGLGWSLVFGGRAPAGALFPRASVEGWCRSHRAREIRVTLDGPRNCASLKELQFDRQGGVRDPHPASSASLLSGG